MFLAAVDGAVMTMCDVGMDPVFVHNGYWTWLGPKETLVFFGVPQQVSGPPTHTLRACPQSTSQLFPLQNFVGWFLTATLASLLYRAIASFLLSNDAPGIIHQPLVSPGPQSQTNMHFHTHTTAAGQSRGSWWFQLVPLLYFAG